MFLLKMNFLLRSKRGVERNRGWEKNRRKFLLTAKGKQVRIENFTVKTKDSDKVRNRKDNVKIDKSVLARQLFIFLCTYFWSANNALND